MPLTIGQQPGAGPAEAEGVLGFCFEKTDQHGYRVERKKSPLLFSRLATVRSVGTTQKDPAEVTTPDQCA